MERPALLRAGLRLEALTLAWMIVEAAGAIAAGWIARSLLLLAFGIDSVIELLSASLLYWRLWREARALPTEGGFIEALERRTARVGGGLLFGLALYVAAQAGYSLMHRHAAETSW